MNEYKKLRYEINMLLHFIGALVIWNVYYATSPQKLEDNIGGWIFFIIALIDSVLLTKKQNETKTKEKDKTV